MRGACVAGGLDLAGVLDVVVSSDTAMFGQPEARSMGEVHLNVVCVRAAVEDRDQPFSHHRT